MSEEPAGATLEPGSPEEVFTTPSDEPPPTTLYPELKKTKSIHSLNESELLPADVDRKVAQGICVLVSPKTYEGDDAKELENLRAKYMRKIVGKIKDGNAVHKGGHTKEFQVEDWMGNELRLTLIWFDDEKLIRETEQTNYSMPLKISGFDWDGDGGDGNAGKLFVDPNMYGDPTRKNQLYWLLCNLTKIMNEEKQPIVERLVRKFSRNYSTVQEVTPAPTAAAPLEPTLEPNGVGVVVLLTNTVHHDSEMSQLHSEFIESIKAGLDVVVQYIMLGEPENVYLCQGAFEVLLRELERVFLSCPFDSKWVRSCDWSSPQVCVSISLFYLHCMASGCKRELLNRDLVAIYNHANPIRLV
eukprot:sb/3479685/